MGRASGAARGSSVPDPCVLNYTPRVLTAAQRLRVSSSLTRFDLKSRGLFIPQPGTSVVHLLLLLRLKVL